MHEVLIYGATGYTGRLCARELVRQGIRPILAGRSERVRALAEELGCRAAVFPLDDPGKIAASLDGVALLINLAGPFDQTQRPLIEACLRARCHYLDIAGEVEPMQAAYAFDQEAREAGIQLMPGAGFGVVPTDVAAYLASRELPDATTLRILYATEGGASRGTLKTVLRDIDRTGVRRVGGELVPAAPAESSRELSVAGKTFTAVYNPWRADLVTAWLSTGIETIETYSTFPGFVVQMMQGRLLWLRDLILRHLLRFLPEGPSERQLRRGSTSVVAIVSNGAEERSVAFRGPEAYLFTAYCLREITRRVLAGDVAPGFQTPSSYGKELLAGAPGIAWE